MIGIPYLGALALIQDVTVLRHRDAKYRRLVKSRLRESNHPVTILAAVSRETAATTSAAVGGETASAVGREKV